MVLSNALSRRPDHIPENDTNNEDLVLLLDKLFIRLINTELKRMIESASESDDLVKNISNILSTKRIPSIKSSYSIGNYKMENFSIKTDATFQKTTRYEN